ncbi:MAG: folate-binding protein YgfZ [Rhodocyclales bacterium]|nr:folate-binding protein YgfZ [Rhodocyclales bacterium]
MPLTPELAELLSRHHCRLAGDEVLAPPSPEGKAHLVPLPSLAVLCAEGPDAAALLHNLLTNEIRAMPVGEARWAALLTPKGRVSALMLLWREAQDRFLLALEAALAEPLRTTLLRYRLRSKVEFLLQEGLFAFARLQPNQIEPPLVPPTLESLDAGHALHLAPGLGLEFLPAEAAPQRLEALLAAGHALGASPDWRLALVRHGLPWLLPENRETFLAQWLNLDLLGGVSFTKGCYPGQEIVARTHYLGRLKRRMYRLGAHEGEAPPTGAECFSPAFGEQAAGRIVLAAPRPEGGFEALAVLQREAAEAGEVRLGAPDGPRAAPLPLPYPLD